MDRTAMLTRKPTLVFLLIVLVLSMLAAGDKVYGKRGGEITLTPDPFSGPLERIVWKHGDHKAIEWEDGLPDAYRQFKVSTSLDTKTGYMRITKLDSRFNGVYSADVNGIQATKKWTLTVLDPVSKPIIHKKCHESTCELSCKNDATVEVQCAWRNGEEELQKYNRTLVLEKTDDKVGKAYTCNCSNPVSSASDQIVPFPPDPVSKPSIIMECTGSMCVLSCENEATVKVQYAWRKGEEELQKYGRTLVLEKTDDKVGKAYTCNCSNSVSFAVSDPVVPFPKPPVIVIVVLVCIFIIIIIIIIIAVIAFKFREKPMAFAQTCPWMRGNADDADGGGAKDPQDMPLKGDTPNGPNA